MYYLTLVHSQQSLEEKSNMADLKLGQRSHEIPNEKRSLENGSHYENSIKVQENPKAEKEGWGDAFYEFSQSTTMHGVQKIAEATPFKLRR